MNGARCYAELFTKAEQIGRLYLLPHFHARGKTFHIYVLPEGQKAIENAGINPPLNKDAVEVYGVTGGQRGWTEVYGWLHKGPWQQDFWTLATQKRELIKIKKEEEEKKKAQKALSDGDRVTTLLSSY